MASDLDDIRALTFDVFGTVVDWRTSVSREVEAALAPKGVSLEWEAFTDAWRALYFRSMVPVRRGERPWANIDELHRENLVALLAEQAIDVLSDDAIDDLNRAWHRLDPWPDSVEGLGV